MFKVLKTKEIINVYALNLEGHETLLYSYPASKYKMTMLSNGICIHKREDKYAAYKKLILPLFNTMVIYDD